jgi:hypothetical protein
VSDPLSLTTLTAEVLGHSLSVRLSLWHLTGGVALAFLTMQTAALLTYNHPLPTWLPSQLRYLLGCLHCLTFWTTLLALLLPTDVLMVASVAVMTELAAATLLANLRSDA